MESSYEKAKRLGVPVIPPIPSKKENGTNPIIAVCGACGLEIRKIMYYSCQKKDCPVQPQVSL